MHPRPTVDVSDPGAILQADTIWAWFSRPMGGAAALLDAWRMHPALRPDGALLPLVLHFSGEFLHKFFTTVRAAGRSFARAVRGLARPAPPLRPDAPRTDRRAAAPDATAGATAPPPRPRRVLELHARADAAALES